MSSYSQGIQAVQELIGKAEDISRFDFVVSAAKDEIPITEINKLVDPSKSVPHKYTSEVCKNLVLWAWSRKPEDVIIEQAAIELILKVATYQGRRYSSRIPLVEGASQRIKIARLAVAAAARVFSTDETGTQVIVTKEHVEFVRDYLEEIYSKDSLNYSGFSSGDFIDAQAAEKNSDGVLKYLQAMPELAELCLRSDYLWASTVEEQLNMSRADASGVIAQLSRWRMLSSGGKQGYRKTAGFIRILREYQETLVQQALKEFEDE